VTIAPVPGDALELVTGKTEIPAGPRERGEIVSLLSRAMANHNLHAQGNSPYLLEVSFSAAASTLYPAGEGHLQESWVSGANWRWDTTLGEYAQTQLSSNGAIWSQSKATMPMRVKLLRQALFAPLLSAGRQDTIRTAGASLDGTALTCVLLSSGANPQTSAMGRQWYETEYCIDPALSAIRIYSAAPGIYALYDYSNGLKFHGRLLPGRITISENHAATVTARITSIADADPSSLALYTPTASMVEQGPATVAEGIERFPMRIPSTSVSEGATVEPVIVHATVNSQGILQEVEALQSNGATSVALNAVNRMEFANRPAPAGASPLLRDVFVNVQIRPAVH
jgi:hypothetical protein